MFSNHLSVTYDFKGIFTYKWFWYNKDIEIIIKYNSQNTYYDVDSWKNIKKSDFS